MMWNSRALVWPCISLLMSSLLPYTYTMAAYHWEITGRTWDDCYDRCANLGKQLVTILTGKDFVNVIEFLATQSNVDHVWLGVRLPDHEDTARYFRWVNGAPLTWANWQWDDPDAMDTKKCVALKYKKVYDTRDCSQRYQCLCEDVTEKFKHPTTESTFALVTKPSTAFRYPFSTEYGRSRMECAIRCTSSAQCNDFTYEAGLCDFFTWALESHRLCMYTNDCPTYRRIILLP